jgi:hypothetical protein
MVDGTPNSPIARKPDDATVTRTSYACFGCWIPVLQQHTAAAQALIVKSATICRIPFREPIEYKNCLWFF